ncbi:MAG TPA: FAD-dependent oxidoreductase [Clostridiales bacterium]|nr:FAD-dependent oxidoreductase [Clostridiales bacterium]
MKTVIVGGVAGGASAAARLRRLDEHAEIIIIERGEYVSFANCGLPYYIGGVIEDMEDLTLQTPESLKARFNIDVRTKSEAVAIDTKEKAITIKNAAGEAYKDSYDALILAPGAKPVLPNIPGISSKKVFTLRNIPDAQKIKDYVNEARPKSAAVVGGGYIGVEIAENLVKAGLDVIIIELADHLIPPLDFEMAADVHAYIRSKGIKLILNNGITAIDETADGLVLKLGRGEIAADFAVVAVGVKPDTDFLAGSGITTNTRGQIIVDAHMRTNVPDVYAVGDAVEVVDYVTGKPAFLPLAGPANRQGRIAADNIAGIDSQYEGTQGSAVLKIFDMTVATTGINERAAKSACIDYDKTYIYAASHATYYPGAKSMSIKAIWDKKTHRLLGAQIVGFDGVDKRMDVIATAMRLGAKVTDLAKLELCYAPPYGSAKDPVNMLGFVAENVISGKLKQFFWDEADSLPRDGSVTLLDVRTPAEVRRGRIEGFINIPLDSLRVRIDEIPAGKPVYVHCHSGLRSYIACRLLEGYGYECYNLAGGWRLYEAARIEKELKK